MRRVLAAAVGEKGDPMGRPARAAAPFSFVPPKRRGLPRVSFPARGGIDSRSSRGKGRERGRMKTRSATGVLEGAFWGGPEGWGGVDESA